MKPIFYFCCQPEEYINPDEAEWCMAWSTLAPQLGTIVSMGDEARWRIVRITTYRPQTAQEVDSVYVAYVHPVGLPIPPESEWDCDLEPDPPQRVSADVVFIGQIELQRSAGRGMVPLRIGEQIESIVEPTEEGEIILEVPKIWIRRRVVPYFPVEEVQIAIPEETIFARAFLCWCELEESTGDLG